jgi:hypothetical protein
MNYRPSRGLIFCLVPLLAIGGTGAWAWNKANHAPLSERAQGDFLALAKKTPREPAAEDTPAARKAFREGCAAMKEKMLGEFPGLRIEKKPVPDEANAFLLLHQLGKMPEESRPKISDSLRALIEGKEPWDLEKAKAGLAESGELLALAEKIAAMPERSSTGMPEDYNGFVSARPAKELFDLLLLKGRIAAEEGDEAEALRLITATGNMSAHFRGIEERTLLSETVAILTDLNRMNSSFEHLLPSLGPGVDLARWKENFATQAYTPADFAEAMKGEWNIMSEYFLYPAILRQKPADGEKVARFHAANFDKLVTELPGTNWQDFASNGCHSLQDGMDEFSGKSLEIAEAFYIGTPAWHKGYLRAASVVAIHQAALDLLILEQNGETLTSQSISRLGPDPVSGKAYRFDAATRTLLPPEEIVAADVKPVKLPW